MRYSERTTPCTSLLNRPTGQRVAHRALATLAVLGLAASAQAQTVSDFFHVAGNGTSANTFTVPTGVTSLFITLEGGGGTGGDGNAGGSGAFVSGSLFVTPGAGLIVLAGAGAGPYNGSAGRSAIQFGTGIPDIVDAGAGGNSGAALGTPAYGGNGGFIGHDGANSDYGGGGGTQISGGAGGPAAAGYGAGFSGTQYHGGDGNFGSGAHAGGAGGDGYFGGGNGSAFYGGGGGSSLTSGFTAADPVTVIDGGAQNGALALGGDGFVEIQYSGAAPVPEASTTASLGLLLTLGLSGLVFASKRKNAVPTI